jgi:hypothetical protein
MVFTCSSSSEGVWVLRVGNLRFRVRWLKFDVKGFGFYVWGSKFEVLGSGFIVVGFGVWGVWVGKLLVNGLECKR